MSFFFPAETDALKTKRVRKMLTIDTLRKLGCQACPLNNLRDLKHPKMNATGSKQPLVMIFGEAPGAVEDQKGRQFVGDSGKLLRPLIPKKYRDQIRWSNTIHCRPPRNATPGVTEIECCRSRSVTDVERYKPKAIFAMGGTPLRWATWEDGITKWRGRY